MLINYYLENRPNKKNELPIRLVVNIMNTRLSTNIGISVPQKMWDPRIQRARRGKLNSKKQTSSEINETLNAIENRMVRFENTCTTRPTLTQMKQALHGNTVDNPPQAPIMHLYEQFVREESIAAQWTSGTLQTIHAFKKHLRLHAGYRKLDYFNDEGVAKMLYYLRAECGMAEISVQKNYKILRWFLRWAVRKEYMKQTELYKSRPKIKLIKQPVIYLTKEELLKLYGYCVPPNGTKVELVDMNGNKYIKTVEDSSALCKTRDLFCFCAFTSLRYSDMAKVRRSDINGGLLYTTTQKTGDRLPIDLNKQAKTILDKYGNEIYPGGLALPVITNQKMNKYLKDLCELCGFNTPVAKTMIKGGERVDEVLPKWRLVGTHAARRTFICFALAIGIPPHVVMKWTGHSDYKSMKPYIEIADKTKAEAMKKISDSWDE